MSPGNCFMPASNIILAIMETETITEVMAVLVLQLGLILFAVRIFGKLAVKIGIPQVLGELSAGIIIGPYALGSIPIPGFPHGLFSLTFAAASGHLPVSNELYTIATVGSIILLFVSGLETDIRLFMRYSVAGSIIGIGGVLFSFIFGNAAGMLILNTSFSDPRCLFLGLVTTATSLGITARILSEQKKLDSPEGVTIMAAAVFDDVLGIIGLAVLLGVVAVMNLDSQADSGFNYQAILLVAGKALGIWLSFTVLGFIFSKKLASFLKFFKSSYDFSILSLGIALILAGIFEKQGLAMIIGACITGLSLSKTDIAPVIIQRIHGIHEFFVPVFFAVMGMMVNIREITSPQVLIFGTIFTGIAFIAKLFGCGAPALLMGFNIKGALRIGLGMVPRGEVALILGGIGIASGILNQQLFSMVIMMTLITTLIAPPLLELSLKIQGRGTRKQVRDEDFSSTTWQFKSEEIANIVINWLLRDLRSEGFFIQTMYTDSGLSQARKDDIIFTIKREGKNVVVETTKTNERFIRTLVYEVIVELYGIIQSLKDTSSPLELKSETFSTQETGKEKASYNIFTHLNPECISFDLKGETREEIITELVDLLSEKDGLIQRDWVIRDVLERERIMDTGMKYGLAIPHGRSDGVEHLAIAMGYKKEGLDFGSIDGELSKIFILLVSARKDPEPYTQLLADIATVFSDEDAREELLNAASPDQILEIFRTKGKKDERHHHTP